ncbi:MAG TPA: aminoglycoside phosphotransferase family protein [Candidatus Saccharimonadales bacterium]|nr:aminoglycoside phosphotransferase family protein [Candidatus Saccharimonadales bacterium]
MQKLHPDEVTIDAVLVHTLLADQSPEWKDLPLQPIAPPGTDNVMFRLGDSLALRLPRTEPAAKNIEKECQWLPKLAPHLPLPIPAPVAQGKPSEVYPLPWEICQLLPGKNLSVSHLDDLQQAAKDIGGFITALQKVDTTNAPTCKRGLPLSTRDAETRNAIAQLGGEIDTKQATAFWDHVLSLPQWESKPVWIHGDLHPGNLLVSNDHISAVIDWGSCGVGDPAVDCMFAWTVLDARSRHIFRNIVKPDEATWERGRGWAFTMGIVAYPYYKVSNPTFAKVAKRAMDEAMRNGV